MSLGRRFAPQPRDNCAVVLFFRPLTTCLVLASLLLSNVAAWVHVGCCETPADQPTSAWAAEAQVDPVQGIAGKGIAGKAAVESASCCCKRSCAAPSSTVAAPVATPDDSAGQPGAPSHEHEHDSDTCHVCQTFHASRHAVVVTGDAFVWMTATITRLRCHGDEEARVDLYRTELSVRGPPSV